MGRGAGSFRKSESSNNNDDGGWDDGDTGVSSGFGGGRGFVRGKDFGRKQDDEPRAGGFGSQKSKAGGGGAGCYKCGVDGHFAKECPNPDSSSERFGGGNRSRACHKCGEEGHMSRECPSNSGGGGACHKCGEIGHFARECPTGGGGGGGGGACHKCGEEGHFARVCPQAGDNDGKPREPLYIPPPPPEEEDELFKSIEQGINFEKYDNIPVKCTGSNAPKKIESFDQAGLTETVRSNVAKAGYKKPTPIQKMAIPCILNGRDVMACAQTGSGKTAAFLLPVFTSMIKENLSGGSMGECSPAALVVGPTRELVSQIYTAALKFSHSTIIRCGLVYGGTSVKHQSEQLLRGAHIVVGTPGRLLDFIGKGKIKLDCLQYFILDEADRMLDMGFEPDIRRLVNDFSMPPKGERITLMFSATFPDEIQKLAGDFMENYLFIAIGRVGGANADITQEIFNIDRHSKREKLISILNESGADRTLVFVGEKRFADFLATMLSQSGFPTTSIHGDRLQKEREIALRDFKFGTAPILIATNVAARGLDIPGVKHVINYDLPSSVDEYVHRIGRTGRCGNLGRATSFYDPAGKDKTLARPLVEILANAKQEVPRWLEEEAEESFGTGFNSGNSHFASRDNRRKFGNGGFGGDREANTNGFSGGGLDTADDDWD